MEAPLQSEDVVSTEALARVDRGALELVFRRASELRAFSLPPEVGAGFMVVDAKRWEAMAEACQSVARLVETGPPPKVYGEGSLTGAKNHSRVDDGKVREPKPLKCERSAAIFARLFAGGSKAVWKYLDELREAGARTNQGKVWTYTNAYNRIRQMSMWAAVKQQQQAQEVA